MRVAPVLIVRDCHVPAKFWLARSTPTKVVFLLGLHRLVLAIGRHRAVVEFLLVVLRLFANLTTISIPRQSPALPAQRCQENSGLNVDASRNPAAPRLCLLHARQHRCRRAGARGHRICLAAQVRSPTVQQPAF